MEPEKLVKTEMGEQASDLKDKDKLLVLACLNWVINQSSWHSSCDAEAFILLLLIMVRVAMCVLVRNNGTLLWRLWGAWWGTDLD